MQFLETLLVHQFAAFTLVLARLGALIMSAPIFSSAAIPVRAKALMAVAIALLISPVVAMHPPADMTNLVIYGKYLVTEALVGLLLGFGITVFLSGIQLTGQIISQLGGTAVAEVFDPTIESNVSVFSQMFYFLSLAMFVLLDGHRLVMDALLDTYQFIPPGHASLGQTYMETLTTLFAQSFLLGIRAAAPTMTALLLSTLVLGLIGRTLPQINILAVGFGINAMLTLGCLFMSLGAIAWAFPQETTAAVEMMRDTLRQTVALR